jgi:PAS domain S-box-containing protein
MARRISEFAWAKTELGDIAGWPEYLRSLVSTILYSPNATILFMGDSYLQIYNDKYMELLPDQHPVALGAPIAQTWGSGWLEIKPVFKEVVENKKSFQFIDVSLPSDPATEEGERFFSFSPSPVVDFSGKVVAILNPVSETTKKVLAERRLMAGTDIKNEKGVSAGLKKQVDDKNQSLIKINEDLKRSEERYHKMIEEVQDYAILLLDTEGKVMNWNAGAEKIKGYKDHEIVGRSFQNFYTKEDRERGLPTRLLRTAAETGRAEQEGWRVRKDGTAFWASVVITALHDANNNVIGFSKVTRDLTERKATEDKMKQYLAELELQNKELEQFAYVASHDLQEPLRKIRTFLDLVKSNLDDPNMVSKYFEKIESSALRMTELIKSILNYSRLSTLKEEFQKIDLNTVLKGVLADLELLTQEKKATITYDKLPVIVASPTQMQQLFLNLIGNSLKFSTETPVITITVKKVDGPEMPGQKVGSLDDKYYLFTFKDNGIGFEQKYADQVFTIFQRLHTRETYAGTGIGLALCRRIVENHRGFITARSQVGVGTEFDVYLPVKGKQL